MLVADGEAKLVTSHGVEVREDQMENVTTAFELVGSNSGESKQDGNRTQHACGSVVTSLQQVRNGELGEFAGFRRHDQNHEQPNPAPRRLPQSGESILESVFCAAEQAAGADPRGEQREYEHVPGQGTSCNQVICFSFYFADLTEADYQQYGHNDGEDNRVQV